MSVVWKGEKDISNRKELGKNVLEGQVMMLLIEKGLDLDRKYIFEQKGSV